VVRSRLQAERAPFVRDWAAPDRSSLEEKLSDEARFIRTWVNSPGRTGAVSPSGRFLARAMARTVDPRKRGLVVELGPGTGPVTEALIERGIAPERLVLVEFAGPFCRLLHRRFPRTRIVQGDAYRLRESLAGVLDEPVTAVVSSLPLLNRPEAERRALLEQAFELMGPKGLFVQFTYGIGSPVPVRDAEGHPQFRGEAQKPVWLNLPPARVWTYRRVDQFVPTVTTGRRKKGGELSFFGAGREKPAPALAFLRKLAEGGKAARR
jgi:phosphatidylethanolamine/phosphatidyl-N-methylethanolamine N-methyltransferase